MRRAPAPRFRPAVHPLEDRRTPAVIAGTDGPDTFRVTPGETGAWVVVNGGAPVAVPAGEVIDLRGGAGDDYYEVSGLLPSNLVRVGGDGGHDALSVRGSSQFDLYAAFDLSHGSVVQPGSAGVIFFTPDAGNAVGRVDVYGTPAQDAFTVHQVLPFTEAWLHPNGGSDTARVIGGETFNVFAAFDQSHGAVVRPGGKGVLFVTASAFDTVGTLEVVGSGAGGDRINVNQVMPLTEVAYDPNGGIDRATVTGGETFDVAADGPAVRVTRPSGRDVVLRAFSAVNTVGRLDLIGTGASNDQFHINGLLPLTEAWIDPNGGDDGVRVSGGTTFDVYSALRRAHDAVVRAGSQAVIVQLGRFSRPPGLELVGTPAGGDTFTLHQSGNSNGTTFIVPNGGVDAVVLEGAPSYYVSGNTPDHDLIDTDFGGKVFVLKPSPTDRVGKVSMVANAKTNFLYASQAGAPTGPTIDYVLSGLEGDDYLYGYLFGFGFGDEGRLGTFTLLGGPGRDELVGGRGRNVLIGGEDGVADRVRTGSGLDRIYTASGDEISGVIYARDIVPTFANGAALTNASGVYAAKAWADADFLRVDALFAALQDTGKSFPLLRPPGTSGAQVAFRRQGGTGPGFNEGFTVAVADGPQQFGNADDTALAGQVLTQLARYWTGDGFGTTLEGTRRFDQFLSLSGWTSTPPADLTNYNVSANGGSPRWYLKSAAFVSEKAKTNEVEDFAETFSAFFAQNAGWNFYSGGPGAAAAPQKVALFQGWLAGLPVPA